MAVTHPRYRCAGSTPARRTGGLCPGGPVRSGRRSFKPEIAGSNPAQDTEAACGLARWALSRKPQRIARWWNGRHAALRRLCPPGVRVQVPPWLLWFVVARFIGPSRPHQCGHYERGRVAETADAAVSKAAAFGRGGSSPSSATASILRGRLTGRTPGSEPVDVGSTPTPGTRALVVQGTSTRPSEGRDPGSIPGRGTLRSRRRSSSGRAPLS